jgi:hypothetical protein
VCTDVVEIGELKAVQNLDPKTKYRPTPTGVSTSRSDERAAGTIGWFLIDSDFNIYLISNNHVWAKENQGKIGDPIVQPGVLDGGDPSNDVFAYLFNFVSIDFSPTAVNSVDLALATPTSIDQVYMSILNVGGITGFRDPILNEKVKKMGRSTGLTEGVVSDVSANVKVNYSTGVAYFSDVFLVSGQDIVKAGDSGSPVLSQDNKFLGLLFAGNDDGSLYVGCKSSNIINASRTLLNKNVSILVANSYPPFFREVMYIRATDLQSIVSLASAFIMLMPLTYIVMIPLAEMRNIYKANMRKL